MGLIVNILIDWKIKDNPVIIISYIELVIYRSNNYVSLIDMIMIFTITFHDENYFMHDKILLQFAARQDYLTLI